MVAASQWIVSGGVSQTGGHLGLVLLCSTAQAGGLAHFDEVGTAAAAPTDCGTGAVQPDDVEGAGHFHPALPRQAGYPVARSLGPEPEYCVFGVAQGISFSLASRVSERQAYLW